MSSLRRTAILARIAASSRESFILNEMQRLGFWPKNKDRPGVVEEIIEREKELIQELKALNKQDKLYKDKARLLNKIRKERMQASKAKRLELKRKRETEKLAKAEAWKKRKETEILYLGEDVSAGLHQQDFQEGKLQEKKLPVFKDVKSLAQQMGISVGELRFLAFQRKVSKINHYKRFLIPKKRGGHRQISAPMPRLKNVQNWILQHILYQVPLHPDAHGFVPGKSIVTNARPHVGASVVINLDLKDFFPGITFPRIKGLFRSMGYSEQIAIILALICTEAEVELVEVNGETFHLMASERHLPQGAPSSPALSNILCIRMDKRLRGAAQLHGFAYTRYADDLTFSSKEKGEAAIQKMLWQAKKIVEDEGFTIHPEKERIMRMGERQEVTGIVVNDKLSLDRKTLRRFRALLFQLEKDGLQGKHWNQSPHLLATVRGFAHYVAMVDPTKGAQFIQRTEQLLFTHVFRHEIRHPSQAQRAREAERLAREKKAQKPWWKFW